MKTNQKGFTLSELIKVLLIIAVLGLVVFSSDSQAEGLTLFGGESEISLAYGPDIHKDLGKKYWEFRYRETLHIFQEDTYWDEFGFSAYSGSMYTLGGDLWITRNNWMFGFGVEGAKRDSDVVDSTGGYELLIEYKITKQWALSLKHRSNCRQICRNIPFLPKGDEDLSNGGFNFLMARYNF